MAKKQNFWNPNASWNERNGRRFGIFKAQNPNTVFTFGDRSENIQDYDDWETIRNKLGVRKGTTPTLAGITILHNGVVTPLEKIVRQDVRTSGAKAQDMEFLVAIAALVDVTSWSDVTTLVDSSEKIKSLSDRTGVTVDEISKVLLATEDDSAYADTFIQVGINIRKNTPLSTDTSAYRVYDRKLWNDFKARRASALSKYLGQSVRADKWNPADILFIREGFDLSSIELDDSTDPKLLLDINAKFAERVKAGDLIPVSVKKTEDAIKGSRGITGELPLDVKNINLKNYTTRGEIVGVPLLVNYDATKTTDDTTIQKKVISWIEQKGKEYVETAATIASGIVGGSSIFYEISGTHFKEFFEDSKDVLKLQSVVISLTSQAVWLNFDKAFVVARSKGNSIQLSLDKARSGSKISSSADFLKTIDQQHSYLIESLILDQYSNVEFL